MNSMIHRVMLREGDKRVAVQRPYHEVREAEAQEMIHHILGESSLPIPTLFQLYKLTRLIF